MSRAHTPLEWEGTAEAFIATMWTGDLQTTKMGTLAWGTRPNSIPLIDGFERIKIVSNPLHAKRHGCTWLVNAPTWLPDSSREPRTGSVNGCR